MHALLGQVFALTDADVIDSAPPFWRKYLKDQIARAHGQEPEKESARSGKGGPGEIKVVEGPAGNDGEPVGVLHKIGAGTTAPKPRYTPEPEFSEAARHEKYQGTLVMDMIVDETGKVRQPRITRPLGMGLDENAVSTVLRWKFDPAKMDGKPVPVFLRIEFSFNLY
jgi:TonB family protein